MPTLHNIDPRTVPQPVQKGKTYIGRTGIKGSIWNLEEIQARIRSGALNLADDNHVWIATADCENNLEDLKWSTGVHVKELLLLLRPAHHTKGGNFIGSQWAHDGNQVWNLCDAYKIQVDHVTWKRNPNAPTYYVKFSMNDEDDAIYLVLLSCHVEQ